MPDLFSFAGGRFGVAPADWLAIEDGPTGIVAARAARMRSERRGDPSPSRPPEPILAWDRRRAD